MNEPAYECREHGHFKNKKKRQKGTCPTCVLHPEEKPAKKPRSLQYRNSHRLPIGKYLEEHLIPLMDGKYRRHHWQHVAFGKNYIKKHRNARDLLMKPEHRHDVFVLRDYTDRIKCGYNHTTQTGGLGGNQKNIGMEGFLYYLYNPETEKVEMHWHGFVSDEKQQDSRTSFANTEKFVQYIRQKFADSDHQYLRVDKDTLWVQSDGCEKQYKSANSCKMNMWISDKYRIEIDWFITPPGHGKCMVDSMAGTDKHFLLKGYLNWNIDPSRTRFGKWLSEAAKAVAYLTDEHRPLNGGRNTVDDDVKLYSRDYTLANYPRSDDVPAQKAQFQIEKGLKKKKG